MELLYKAGELSQSEIDTPIEMEVTLDQFVSNIGYVRQISGKLYIEPKYFSDGFFHFSGLRGMYHYEGSLTSPGCNEIVQWIVMDEPLYVLRRSLVSAKL